jgi:hypothetical protein
VDVVAAKLSWRRLPWALEIASIALFYGLYSAIRLLAPHRVGAAFDHAASVASFEQALGFYNEPGVNAFLARHASLEELASYYYVSLHYVVTPLVLIWLWRSRARAYGPLRSALVLSSAIALVIYAAWPLAPPRYAMAGAVDTVNTVIANSGHGVSGLVNDIAAMPSMHVGWSLWCAVVIARVSQSRLRHFAWLYPIATTAVVVATANHYLLDAIGGAVVVGLPLVLTGAFRRRTATAREELTPAQLHHCAA